MVIVYLALGSNIGNRKNNLEKAILLLKQKLFVQRISSIYETKPIGFADQRNFYNLSLKAKTSLDAFSLLKFVKEIEKEMKRKE